MKTFKSIFVFILAVISVGFAIYYFINFFIPPVPPEKPVAETQSINTSDPIVSAFNAGNFTDGIGLANDALKASPQSVPALLSLSFLYAQKGSLEFTEKENGQKAAEYARRAIALDPKNASAYIVLGYATEIMSDFKGAIATYAKAIALNPNNAEAYVHRGHAYDLSGDRKNAEDDYLKASSIEPSNLGAIQNLGRLYARQGKMDLAEQQFLTIVSVSQNARAKADAYYSLSGMAFYSTSTDAVDQALSYASSSQAVDPTYPQAYVALGRAYNAKGNISAAKEFLAKALDLYPHLSAADELLSTIYIKEKNTARALLYMEAEKSDALVDIGLMADERSAIIFRTDFNEASLYAENNRQAEAVASLKDAIKVNKDPLSALILKFALDDAVHNQFKNIAEYKPFKDLLAEFEKSIPPPQAKTSSQLMLDKVQKIILGFFEADTAYATITVSTCASVEWGTERGTIVRQFEDTDAFSIALSQYFCDVLVKGYSGDWSQLGEADAKAKSQSHGGGFNDGYMGLKNYLGCYNGLGAWFVPTPPPPPPPPPPPTDVPTGGGGGCPSGQTYCANLNACATSCGNANPNYTPFVPNPNIPLTTGGPVKLKKLTITPPLGNPGYSCRVAWNDAFTSYDSNTVCTFTGPNNLSLTFHPANTTAPLYNDSGSLHQDSLYKMSCSEGPDTDVEKVEGVCRLNWAYVEVN